MQQDTSKLQLPRCRVTLQYKPTKRTTAIAADGGAGGAVADPTRVTGP